MPRNHSALNLNSFQVNSLPYIEIQNPPAKLLIDTGSHTSLIRPIIAEQNFPHLIYNSKHTLITCTGNTNTQYKSKIPLLSEYGLNAELEFILFNFHDYFDGIIGIRDLRKLNLNIDLTNKRLFNDSTEIPLVYRDEFNIQKIEIPPLSIVIKNINTNIPDETEIFMPHLHNKVIEIPASLLLVRNGTVPLEIRNLSNESIIINFDSNSIREKAEIFHSEIFELFNIEQIQSKPFTPSDFEDCDFSLIRSDHLNSEEQSELKKIILQFRDILYKPNEKLTFTHQVKHEIKTSDEIPIHTKSYRYPFVHKQEVQKQIAQMLKDEIIRPSSSPWSSPVWIVPKKQDASGKKKWRIVIDYRKINEKTIDDRYPIPNISDILDKLGRSQYFTTLDLASGFHQIEMHPSSIPKTAFNVENGHFEYIRMPFGLKNAPATFQRVMDNVLKDLQGKICLVYMDDIIIFSTSLQEHITNIKTVFSRLRENNLKIQLDKSEFLRKSVEFLGHVITPDGIKPNPRKIEAIQKFPIPRTPKEIKSFLGLIGYYRKFIKNFAQLTKPLTNCLKKNNKVEHTLEFTQSFETCKNILMNDPILQHPDFSKQFNLTTDASNFAIGAVLSQGPIGKDLPIAYASRTLNPAELNYSTIEKELLAIVWATKYFRPYLFGTRFKIITDHKPLQWLFSVKEPGSKLVRWRLKLEEYDYEIVYKKGKQNTNADSLSRIQINPIEYDQLSMIPQVDPNDIPQIPLEDLDEILNSLPEEKPSRAKPKINIISNKILRPANKQKTKTIKETPNTDLETQHSSAENPIIGAPYVQKATNLYKNQMVFRYSNNNQLRVQKQQIFDKHRTYIFLNSEPSEEDICKIIKEHFIPKNTYCLHFINKTIEPILLNTFQKYFKHNSFTLYISNTLLEDINNRDEQQLKIKYYHETKTSHRGIQENIIALKKNFYWPNLENDVKTYVNLCEICQKSKYERHPNKLIFKPTPIGYEPFDHIYIDIYKTHSTSFLTIIDSFSKIGQAYPLMTPTSTEVANKLIIYFNHYGLPRKITTDNGSTFKNETIQNLCSLHQIEIHYCTPHNPNSNSPIERLHSTLSETILTLKNKKPNENIINLMNYAILSYNNSTHSALRYTPFQIIKGKLDYKNPLELSEDQKLTQYIQEHSENLKIINEEIHEKLTSKQKSNLDKLNKNRQENIEIDPDKPLYTKTFPKRSKMKETNKYKEIPKPVNIKENAVSVQNKNIHKNILKPQRILVSDGTLPSTSATTPGYKLRNKRN